MTTESQQHQTPKKRSRMVVDREVQYGVVWKTLTHWVVLFACNSFGLVIWVSLLEQPEVHWKQTLSDSFDRFLPFFIISAALIPAFVLDTLKLTNRFAGPISRLRTEILNAAEGRPVRRLKFRSNDYWRDIADGFNSLVERAGSSFESNQAKDAGNP